MSTLLLKVVKLGPRGRAGRRPIAPPVGRFPLFVVRRWGGEVCGSGGHDGDGDSNPTPSGGHECGGDPGGRRLRVDWIVHMVDHIYVSTYACRRAVRERCPRGDRRTDAATDPRRGPRGRAVGRRARRAGRHAPAGRVASPQGAARRRPRRGPPRRPATALPAASGTADGARRVARAVPGGVGGPARLARAAPRRTADTDPPERQRSTDERRPRPPTTASLERTADGGVIRFERHLPVPDPRRLGRDHRTRSGWPTGGCRSTPTSPSTSARAARWCSPAAATSR